MRPSIQNGKACVHEDEIGMLLGRSEKGYRSVVGTAGRRVTRRHRTLNLSGGAGAVFDDP